jgi:hypothetical protein
MPAGALPAAEVSVRFRAAVALVPRVADDKVREADCPKAQGTAADSMAMARAVRKEGNLLIQFNNLSA